MNATSTAVSPAVQTKPQRPNRVVKPNSTVKMGDRVSVQGSNQTATVTAITVLPTGAMADITWENGHKGRLPTGKLTPVQTPKTGTVAQLTGKVVTVAPERERKVEDPRIKGLEARLRTLETENQGLRKTGQSQVLAELQYLKKNLLTEKNHSKTVEGKNINFQLALEALGLTAAAVAKIADGQPLVTEDLPKNQTPDLSVLVKK